MRKLNSNLNNKVLYCKNFACFILICCEALGLTSRFIIIIIELVFFALEFYVQLGTSKLFQSYTLTFKRRFTFIYLEIYKRYM